MRNIILIGFMGTGKSSVGKFLAKRLGAELLDSDAAVEAREKRKISEIFEKDGESGFRRIEKDVLAELLARPNAVITTGGGAVIDADNRRAMRASGIVVSFSASPEMILERIGKTKHRPLLNRGDRLAEIRRLLDERRAYYDDCDIKIETDGMTPFEVSEIVMEALKQKGLL